MCPCPFCTTIALILAPLLLMKSTRNWLKNKIKRHHCACDMCQRAEHDSHAAMGTPCSCVSCAGQKKKGKTKCQKKA